MSPHERPVGRVLEEVEQQPIPTEEVTRDGHRVIRVFCYARGSDNTQVLWVGRRAGPAPIAGASGLAYDTLDM